MQALCTAPSTETTATTTAVPCVRASKNSEHLLCIIFRHNWCTLNRFLPCARVVYSTSNRDNSNNNSSAVCPLRRKIQNTMYYFTSPVSIAAIIVQIICTPNVSGNSHGVFDPRQQLDKNMQVCTIRDSVITITRLLRHNTYYIHTYLHIYICMCVHIFSFVTASRQVIILNNNP